MAYRFQVDQSACINCGICMDLCPVRCLRCDLAYLCPSIGVIGAENGKARLAVPVVQPR